MTRKKTIILSLAILLAGVIITAVIFLTEPKAVQEGAIRETAMLVEVIDVHRGNYFPVIIATGTIEPSQDVVLSPKVGGEVVRLAPVFTPGGNVRKGETLLQIESADYENTLLMRKSDLHQAEADLTLEMGRQHIARQDYQLLEESVKGANESLVLREPQLNAARSRVESAQAAVQQAELALERTVVKAPFDAHVISRNVHVGSQVSPGEDLGRIVGMDVYWAVVSMPVSKLRWVTFPQGANNKGSEVRLRNRSSWKEDEYRMGYLHKLVGALDSQTRLARMLVIIPDPLALEKTNRGQRPLIIGEFVEASVTANEIRDVVRLSRNYVRKDEAVWVMKNGKLNISKVNVVFTDNQYAYISTGLNEGDKVVVTNIATVVEGAGLRVEADSGQIKGNMQDTGKNN
jgi:RND family efflux transporter MFP subunit